MSADREAWRRFICSPVHPYRHLASLGSSVIGAKSDAIDLADLESFLEKLRGDSDVFLLADMGDLISGQYEAYLKEELPRLLDSMANEIERRDAIVGPGIRGNVRWDRTLIGRISGTLPLGRYYSRTAHRTYSLPENRLLLWLLDNLNTSTRSLVRRSSSRAPHGVLTSLMSASEDAMAHNWLSEVGVPSVLTQSMLDAARLHKRPEYRRAAQLAEARQRLSSPIEDRWYAILMLLAVGWLEPISDDDLFELYALTLVIDALSSDVGFGTPAEYGLVIGGRSHVAAFSSEMGHLRVMFDQSPAIKGVWTQRYKSIVRMHSGVSGSSRRPDITIVLETPTGDERYVIIEVKRTSNERYISDSIYKVFGYLHDFADIWHPAQPNPRSMLLVPEGVKREIDEPFADVAIVSANDRTALSSALTAALLGPSE